VHPPFGRAVPSKRLFSCKNSVATYRFSTYTMALSGIKVVVMDVA
jgi:hypothetical protein